MSLIINLRLQTIINDYEQIYMSTMIKFTKYVENIRDQTILRQVESDLENYHLVYKNFEFMKKKQEPAGCKTNLSKEIIRPNNSCPKLKFYINN